MSSKFEITPGNWEVETTDQYGEYFLNLAYEEQETAYDDPDNIDPGEREGRIDLDLAFHRDHCNARLMSYTPQLWELVQIFALTQYGEDNLIHLHDRAQDLVQEITREQ
jgi:hypothetical protein